MKTNIKYLLITVVSSLLLAGCCTSRHPTEWEYKVASPNGGPMKVQEAFLNELGKDGWVLISQNDGRIFYFKRAKK